MPRVSGLDVLRAIRQQRSASELPVIMVTARQDSADVVEALNSGANDYVTKPVDMPVALARIQAQLARKRAEAASARARSATRSRFAAQTTVCGTGICAPT